MSTTVLGPLPNEKKDPALVTVATLRLYRGTGTAREVLRDIASRPEATPPGNDSL